MRNRLRVANPTGPATAGGAAAVGVLAGSARHRVPIAAETPAITGVDLGISHPKVVLLRYDGGCMVYSCTIMGCGLHRAYTATTSRPSHFEATPTMTTKAPKTATAADRSIGGRVAALRVAQGLSQTALGEALGVSFQQVQKYERGCNRISAGRLQTIADLLKVPVETFFADRLTDGPDGSDLRTFYDDPQVMQLVTAFTSIADEITRESVLSIVKAAAKIQPGNTD